MFNLKAYSGNAPQKVWTPWGMSDRVTYFAKGLCFASTPSHGGLRISLGLLRQHTNKDVPWLIKNLATDTMGSYAFFEEDCAAQALLFDCLPMLLVVSGYENEKSERMFTHGRNMMQRYWPSYFETESEV